ncbi:UNVERIFIED_CONTAM: hypothetical protein GTU68_020244 [Idotea baltica]|nr:hypothetical protein [Idotea baltica]
MRGPGETQLETDRRLLNVRVKSLNAKLDKVMRQREQGRKQRKKSGTKMLALVGYTNAGKSTLFNLLTNAGVYAEDQLFATLDPTVRQFTGLAGSQAVISDTVGFVRDLPHELVAAFRATLQEALDADLLLHVIDDSNSEHRDHMAEVYKVLGELNIDDIPVIEIYNKIDQSGAQKMLQLDAAETVDKVWLSAHKNIGIDLLLKAIEERLHRTHLNIKFELPMNQARLRAQLYELEAIRAEQIGDSGQWQIEVELPLEKWQQLAKSNDKRNKRGAEFVSTLLTQQGVITETNPQDW